MVDYLAKKGIPISRERVQTLMRRQGLRAIYQNHAPHVQLIASERFPLLVDLKEVQGSGIRFGATISLYRLRKASSYSWALWMLFPACSSVGNSYGQPLTRRILAWRP